MENVIKKLKERTKKLKERRRNLDELIQASAKASRPTALIRLDFASVCEEIKFNESIIKALKELDSDSE